MAGSAQTPLGDWITRTFAPPASKLSKAMSGTPDGTGSLTPEQIEERRKKLMSAGQAGQSTQSYLAKMFGLGQ